MRKDHKLVILQKDDTTVLVVLTFTDKALADYAFGVWITLRIIRQSILPKLVSNTAKLTKYKVVGSSLYLVVLDPNMTSKLVKKIKKVMLTFLEIVYNNLLVNYRLKQR